MFFSIMTLHVYPVHSDMSVQCFRFSEGCRIQVLLFELLCSPQIRNHSMSVNASNIIMFALSLQSAQEPNDCGENVEGKE